MLNFFCIILGAKKKSKTGVERHGNKAWFRIFGMYFAAAIILTTRSVTAKSRTCVSIRYFLKVKGGPTFVHRACAVCRPSLAVAKCFWFILVQGLL